MRISIDNPTGGLTQWDVGQRLLVEDIQAGVLVDFKIRNQEPLGMKTYEDGGGIYVDIPNILLQNDGYLYVYFYVLDGEKGYTTLTWRCVVASRPKPSDYVYTETEVLTWHTLEERVSYLEQHGGSGGAGGYYTPSIEQVADDSLRFTYTQSQAGMPGVEPVTVTLPAGPRGVPGEPGPAGHTPEKGTDYFTANEIQDIAEQAAQLVDVPAGGASVRWQTVATMTLEEETNEILISQDMDGTPISDYRAIAMLASIDTPADSTQASTNGSVWIYPSSANFNAVIRVISIISGWKTSGRTLSAFFTGDSDAMVAIAGGVFNPIPWTVPEADIFNGMRLHIHNAGDHFPAGTELRLTVLSGRE